MISAFYRKHFFRCSDINNGICSPGAFMYILCLFHFRTSRIHPHSTQLAAVDPPQAWRESCARLLLNSTRTMTLSPTSTTDSTRSWTVCAKITTTPRISSSTVATRSFAGLLRMRWDSGGRWRNVARWRWAGKLVTLTTHWQCLSTERVRHSTEAK